MRALTVRGRRRPGHPPAPSDVTALDSTEELPDDDEWAPRVFGLCEDLCHKFGESPIDETPGSVAYVLASKVPDLFFKQLSEGVVFDGDSAGQTRATHHQIINVDRLCDDLALAADECFGKSVHGAK